jgi:hypothetical protein
MAASGQPIAIPTLDMIAADPQRASGLPRAALSALLLRTAAISTVLAAALADTQIETPSPSQNLAPTLVSADALAARWEVPASWIREQARAHRLPSMKLGHYLRFNLEEAERFLASLSPDCTLSAPLRSHSRRTIHRVYDGQNAEIASTATKVDPGADGGSTRGDAEYGGTLGARRGSHSGIDGAPHPRSHGRRERS